MECFTTRTLLDYARSGRAGLLPVPCFHVVLALPRDVAEIAFQNKAVVYGLLMWISAETLQTVAANPKWLGAEIDVTAVLHTWG